jgi:hypothetical protein
MRYKLACLSALMLTGCATRDPQGADALATVEAVCSVENLSSFVGRKATAELAHFLLEQSGARVLRWIPPDSAVTMDYSPLRLNIAYDRTMQIERFSCG